jgi:hypothetical protein
MRLLVVAVLLAASLSGCLTATIRTKDHKYISAKIKRSDRDAIFVVVEGTSREQRIARGNIVDIFHAGSLAAGIGTTGVAVGSVMLGGSVAVGRGASGWRSLNTKITCGIVGFVGVMLALVSAGPMIIGWVERYRSRRAAAMEIDPPGTPDTVDEPGLSFPRFTRDGPALLTW